MIKKTFITVLSLPSIIYGFFCVVFPLFGFRIEINKGVPQTFFSIALFICSAVLFTMTNGKGKIHVVPTISLFVVFIVVYQNIIVGSVCVALTVLLVCFDKNKIVKIVCIFAVVLLFVAIILIYALAHILFSGSSPICSSESVSPEGTTVVYEDKYFHGTGNILVTVSAQSRNELDLYLFRIVGKEWDILDYWCCDSSKTMPEIEWVSENEIRIIGEVFSLNSRTKEVRYSEDYHIIRMD